MSTADSGDYEASGIDGLEMHIHGNAQDQRGQIMRAGKLVVHGDVGQIFTYGAKGVAINNRTRSTRPLASSSTAGVDTEYIQDKTIFEA